jgi:hypothetical protein
MNILSHKILSRRTLLRGLGVSLGLPLLDIMRPRRVGAESAVAPPRVAFFYIPNGVVQEAWHPDEAGADYRLPASLQPLEPFRSRMNVFTGLDREFRGGTGVHAQAACAWLSS